VPSKPTAQVNGITMYCEMHGAEEPLLLINGLGADITLLTAIIAWCARFCQVAAFDNRGAGRTDKPDAPYTIGLLAADTAALMDVLALERASVLGISMGGRIVLELTLSCRARVGTLVLVSTSAAGRGKVTMSWPMLLLRPLTWAGLLRGSSPQPRYAHLRQRQASVSYDATNRRGQIRVPTLILHGRRDKSMPLEPGERMHAGIPGPADRAVPRRPHVLPVLRVPAVPRPGRPLPRQVTTEPAATQIPTQFWRDGR
jgi:3-oxoadipate enol-lactonase